MVTQNFSSCGKQMLLSSCVYVGFSLQWLLLLWSMVSRAHRLQHLWYISLLAPRYVESSWTRNWTHVPCIGRQILKPWTTRKVQDTLSLIIDFSYIWKSPVCQKKYDNHWTDMPWYSQVIPQSRSVYYTEYFISGCRNLRDHLRILPTTSAKLNFLLLLIQVSHIFPMLFFVYFLLSGMILFPQIHMYEFYTLFKFNI